MAREDEMQRSRNRNRRRRRRARRIRRIAMRTLALLLLLAALGCAFYLGRHYLQEYRTRRTNDQLKQLYNGAPAGTAQSEPTAIPEPQASAQVSPVLESASIGWSGSALQGAQMPVAQDEPLPPVQASFQALRAENGDVRAWLQMGDQIDLPVVQRDNSYYLDNDFYGKSSNAGALFLDARNCFWPADQNLIVYGHNMKDGTMFGTLSFFRTLENLQAHPLVQFNTIYEDGQYVPFALFDASMAKGNAAYFDLLRFNFASAEDFGAFVTEARQRSLFSIPVEVGPGDALLTLCTCSYTLEDGRFLIVCRKLRPGESAEDVAALVSQSVPN